MATLLSALETQVRRQLMEPADLSTPSAPTVTPQGTAGSKTIRYSIVAINTTGSTDGSAVGTSTTSHATLDGTNYNRITWTAVTGATGYWVYRTSTNGTAPTTTGRIAVLGAVTTYDDQGAAGDSATAPVTNTTGLTSPFWSSAELIDIMNLGFKDLWGALIDLHQEHFLTDDITNVSISASTGSLSGVPSDVFRVHIIEPKNTSSSGSYRNLVFVPRDWNSPDFIYARQLGNVDPTQDNVIFYCVTNVGAPVGAPTVLIAPTLSSAIAAAALRFTYIPVISAKVSSDWNPIPGESDAAVIAWTVAFALAKQREDNSPDSAWIAVYGTEKQNILTRSTPRQSQEPDVVEPMFGGLW
jgi:hypothetical protein